MTAEGPNQGATGDAPDTDAPRSTGASSGGQSPLSAQGGGEFVDEHPEVLVGAAFAGGFALAQILKQLSG
jgi:hypothetical protein